MRPLMRTLRRPMMYPYLGCLCERGHANPTAILVKHPNCFFTCLSSRSDIITSSAPVAQLDRVLGYEPRGRGFESCRARQNINGLRVKIVSHFCFFPLWIKRWIKRNFSVIESPCVFSAAMNFSRFPNLPLKTRPEYLFQGCLDA